MKPLFFYNFQKKIYKADAAGRSVSKPVSLTSGVLIVGKIHTAGTIAPHLVRLGLVRNTNIAKGTTDPRVEFILPK